MLYKAFSRLRYLSAIVWVIIALMAFFTHDPYLNIAVVLAVIVVAVFFGIAIPIELNALLKTYKPNERRK